LRELNAEIMAAVAQSDHQRLPALLAEQRAIVTLLAPALTEFGRSEVRASVRQAIVVATSERARLALLLNDCQAKAAVISAYSPPQPASPCGDVGP
jgi:hypothetical protein